MGGMSKCGHVDRREAARSGQREWQVRKRRLWQVRSEGHAEDDRDKVGWRWTAQHPPSPSTPSRAENLLYVSRSGLGMRWNCWGIFGNS